ncbi:MAG: GGDEF domain-containing protein [Actinomycetota bacterium]|nr:GGDEF domain-containing protein [Actinomycetota bacterium]
MTDPAAPAVTPALATRDSVRLAVAIREYPRTLYFAGGMLVLFTVIDIVTPNQNPATRDLRVYVVYLCMAAALFGLGALLSGDAVPEAARKWVFAAGGILMGLGLAVNVVVVRETSAYAIMLLLLTVCGAATLAWWPFALECAAILATCVWLLWSLPIDHPVNWFLLTIGSACVGAVLLAVRLGTVDELAAATAQVQRMAMTDALTGLLNRHGLDEHLPVLAAASGRLDLDLFAAFVDIRGLKAANDRLGHEFGDLVIQSAARTVAAATRQGDLVARWGGDEFVVVGIGSLTEAEALAQRIEATQRWPEADPGQWSGSLSVGLAVRRAGAEPIADLVSRADEDMYRRRAGA